ncbi:unnamed protein product [Linum trigynum]|uniref:Uncharacterized protein n=1 Tax=Linum trigynum TaxID=586398 RepID=A0AAV2GI16_9ROSI
MTMLLSLSSDLSIPLPNFEMLGTNLGGRILRLGYGKEEKEENTDADGGVGGGHNRISGGDEELESEERRERRERMRLGRTTTSTIEKDRSGI